MRNFLTDKDFELIVINSFASRVFGCLPYQIASIVQLNGLIVLAISLHKFFLPSPLNMSQRLVLVDDTSPDIQYYGPWFKVQNTQLDTDDLGPPFENTLHGVNVSANMSFSFSGMS